MRTDEYVYRCPTLYRSIHGAVGTLHTCLVLSDFQQMYLYTVQVHVHVFAHACMYMYMYVHMHACTCAYTCTCVYLLFIAGHVGSFKWSVYLHQPGPVPAPAHLFTEVCIIMYRIAGIFRGVKFL